MLSDTEIDDWADYWEIPRQELDRLIEAIEGKLLRRAQRPQIGDEIGDKIVKLFGDGKWHHAEAIAKRLQTDSARVVDTLNNIERRALRRRQESSRARFRPPGSQTKPLPGANDLLGAPMCAARRRDAALVESVGCAKSR